MVTFVFHMKNISSFLLVEIVLVRTGPHRGVVLQSQEAVCDLGREVKGLSCNLGGREGKYEKREE